MNITQRQLKFRIWDKRTKSFSISPENNKSLGSWFNQHLFYSYIDPEDVILSQYTGLLDANGIEIYEHDLIQFPFQTKRSCPGHNCIFTIIFDKGRFILYNETCCNYNKEDDILYECKLDLNTQVNYNSKEIFIVGNIFENQDIVDNVDNFVDNSNNESISVK